MTHNELKEKALKKISVKKEYDALEPEFSLLKEMLKVRKRVGLSQAQIAERWAQNLNLLQDWNHH